MYSQNYHSMETILIYLIIGIGWTIIWEAIYYTQDELFSNQQRVGYILLWPIGVVGFVLGLINGIIKFINENKNN